MNTIKNVWRWSLLVNFLVSKPFRARYLGRSGKGHGTFLKPVPDPNSSLASYKEQNTTKSENLPSIVMDLAVQKELQGEINVHAEKVENSFNQPLDIYYEVNGKGKIIFVSSSVKTVLGYDRQEIIGMPAQIFCKDLSVFQEGSGQFEEGKKAINETISLFHKNGNVKMIHHAVVPKYRHKRNFIGAAGVMRGITEEILVQRKVKESTVKFYALLEGAVDAILIVDEETGRVVDINKQAQILLGYLKSEIKGSTLDVFQPVHAEKEMRSRLNLIEENQQVLIESQIRTKSSIILDVELTVRKMKVGQQLVFQTFIKDVTQQKIDSAIKLLEKKVLAKLVKNCSITKTLNYICLGIEKIYPDMKCAILQYDEKNNIIKKFVGPGLPKNYIEGMEKLPVEPSLSACGIGAHAEDLTIVTDIQSDERCKCQADLAKKANLVSCWSMPVMSTSKELLATFAIYLSYSKKPQKGQLILIEIFTNLLSLALENFKIREDILDKEKKMEDLNLFLVKQNKQLEEYTYITSHNFRAPLTNILSLINLKEENEDIDDTFIWSNLKKTSKNLKCTIDGLNEVLKSGWELNKFSEVISIKTVFKNVMTNVLTKTEKKDVRLKLDCEHLEWINYPKIYLESIIQNLVTNAIKYAHPDRKLFVQIYTEEVNGDVFLYVKDNGLGMNLKTIGDKLFGLRKTFHSNKDAKGLGLFMTKAQVESMGGTICVESEVNLGSTFIVNFGQVSIARSHSQGVTNDIISVEADQ